MTNRITHLIKTAAALSATACMASAAHAAAIVHTLTVSSLAGGAGYLNNSGGTLEFDVRSILSAYLNPQITAVTYSAGITDDGGDINESLSHSDYAYRYTDTSQCIRPTIFSSCSNNHIEVYTRATYHHYYNFSETMQVATEGGETGAVSTAYYYVPPPSSNYLGTVYDGMDANFNIYNDDRYYYSDHYTYAEQGYQGDAALQRQLRDSDVAATFADGFVRFQVQVENDALFTGGSLSFSIEEGAAAGGPQNAVPEPGTLWLVGLAAALGLPGLQRRRTVRNASS